MTDGTRHSTPRRGAAVPRPAGLVILLVAAAAACGGGEASFEPGAAEDGLVVLAGPPANVALTWWDRTGARPVELPEGRPAWVSGSRGRDLALTTADGRVFVSDRLRADRGPGWTETRPVGSTGRPIEDALSFAMFAPDGGRAAALAGTFGEAPFRVVILDPATGGTLVIPVDRPAAVGPPAWLDGDRLMVLVAAEPDPATLVIDVATVDTAPGPAGVAFAAASGDGRTVAFRIPGEAAPRVADAAAWSRGESPGVPVEASGSERAGVIALDRRGRRLAIEWLTADGRAAGIGVYVLEDERWRMARRIDLPTDAGAVVTWIR